MNGKIIIILFFSFLLLAGMPFYVYAENDTSLIHNDKKFTLLTDPAQLSIKLPDRVTKTLRIKPGMSILDVGAGTGIFTFHFAEALKGTGEVFATETDPDMIEYIKKRNEDFKYKNIFPVLIKADGLDPFYKQHSFDIIFLCSVYYFFRHPEDYFRELKPSLKKNGRLYILQYKEDFAFSDFMFNEYKKLIQVLISKGEKFPVFQRLSPETQYFIKMVQKTRYPSEKVRHEIPSKIKIKIIEDLNQMLSDRYLFNDLVDYYYTKENLSQQRFLLKTLNPTYFELVKWLVIQLEKNRVFERGGEKLTDIDKERLHLLNRILLSNLFQLHLFIPESTFITVEKNSIIATLKAAGYRFVREYDFLPLHYFLEFKRDN